MPTPEKLAAEKKFIESIAHELRTPLSVIKTNMEVRLMDLDLSPEGQRVLKTNLEQIERVAQKLNELLRVVDRFVKAASS